MKSGGGFGWALVALPLIAGCGSAGTATSSNDGGGGGAAKGTGGSAGASDGGGGASTSSGGGGSASGGGGGGTIAPGEPFSVDDESWTFVEVDGAFCANGGKTGVGINKTSRSKNVMFYFEGGGACWDETTCYVLNTGTYVQTGFGESEFALEKSTVLNLPTFDRDDAANPFKDYSFVYVPYCTGDVHAGNKVASYGGRTTMHVGFANVTALLPRVIGTWGDASKVIVAGSSAGGFGAGFNWFRIKGAYPDGKVYLVDDSGPPLPPPYADANEPIWRAAWGLDPNLPAGCAACKQHLEALLPYVASAYPDERGALLSYYDDTVIPTFYGIPVTDMPDALDTIAKNDLGPQKNARYFYASGPGHVLLLGGETFLSQKGVGLRDWLGAMLTDQTTGWDDLSP